MTQGIPGPDTDQNCGPTPLTLEFAREQLRFLIAGGERNAWAIGDLLNRLEMSRLAYRAGYGKTKTWLDATVPEAKGKTSTLYRYANVAGLYSQEHVDQWGLAKLYCLMIHDGETHTAGPRRDPAEREVQLLQADGSILVKKFRDCTCRELRESRRQKTAPTDSSPSNSQQDNAPGHPQSVEAASRQSMDFLKEQIASAARRSRKWFWPFTHAR